MNKKNQRARSPMAASFGSFFLKTKTLLGEFRENEKVRKIPAILFTLLALLTVFAPYQQSTSLSGGALRGVLVYVVVGLFGLTTLFLIIIFRKRDFSWWNILAMIPAFLYLALNIFHSYGEVSAGGFAVALWVEFCLFPRDVKLKTFSIFRRFWIVVCIVGVLCYLCYILNLPIPYEKVGYYAGVKTQWYIDYRVSFLFERHDGLLRLCGICNEPGLFGTFCALILCASRMRLKKIGNIIILIAGMLTFSVAFMILAVLYMVLAAIIKICREKNQKKKIVQIVCAVLAIVLYFVVLPNIRTGNTTIDYTIGRLSITSEGLAGDNRTTEKFDELYESTSFTDLLVGLGKFYTKEHGIVKNLSYKVYILEYGMIGCIAMWGTLLIVAVHYCKKDLMALLVVVVFFASIYQRPGIITSTYVVALFGGIEYVLSEFSRNLMMRSKVRSLGKGKQADKDDSGSTHKYKLMHFVPTLNTGGAETLIKNYLVEIDKSKFDPVLLCLNHSGSHLYEDFLAKNGIRVLYAEDYLVVRRVPKVVRKAVNYAQKYVIARRIIKRESPDIMHLHLYMNTVIRFARPKKNVVMFYTVHSTPKTIWSSDTRQKRAELKATKWLVKHYGMRFIVLHDEMKKEVNELFGVSDSVVLNNGIYVEEYKRKKNKRQIRKSIGVPEDAFVIGHVGRFAFPKNHEFLVDVFDRISKKNKKAFLLMVGKGSETKKIIQKIDDNGLGDKCVIFSDRADMPDLFSAMDDFVFPSRYEGLGIALIEAQVTGLPCFVSDAVPEYSTISNLVTRLPLNAGAGIWADIIIKSRRPRKIAVNDDDWDIKTVVKKLENIYEEAIASKVRKVV